MNAPMTARTPTRRASCAVATVSLAGCFGCHMSLLDIDERLFELIELVEFDRSPLTDIKTVGPCDIGLIEGGLCNAENVRGAARVPRHCKTLVAVGACAITGGLPAQRNHLDVGACMRSTSRVYGSRGAQRPRAAAAAEPVHPIHEVVHVDHFLPGCPPRPTPSGSFLHRPDGRAHAALRHG
jgi:NAD-reducing hydrogenase small subunit